jgi:transposase InsO family protein
VRRYLLACDAYPSNEGPHTRRAFERIFHKYGLPRSILSDNGSPFGSPGLARLSRLSLWWIRLGIRMDASCQGTPSRTARSPVAAIWQKQRDVICNRRDVNALAMQQRLVRRSEAGLRKLQREVGLPLSLRSFGNTTPRRPAISDSRVTNTILSAQCRSCVHHSAAAAKVSAA